MDKFAKITFTTAVIFFLALSIGSPFGSKSAWQGNKDHSQTKAVPTCIGAGQAGYYNKNYCCQGSSAVEMVKISEQLAVSDFVCVDSKELI